MVLDALTHAELEIILIRPEDALQQILKTLNVANAAKHLDLGDFRSISGKVSNPPFIIFMMCN